MLEDIVLVQGEVTQAGIWDHSHASSILLSDWSIDAVTEKPNSFLLIFEVDVKRREHEYEADCLWNSKD